MRLGVGLGQRLVSGRLLGMLVLLVFILLRFSLDSVLDDKSPFLLFTLAVMVAAVYGGFRTALVIALLGGAAGMYFADQGASHSPFTTGHLLQLALYLAVSIGTAALAHSLRRARERLECVARQQFELLARLRRADRTKDEFLARVSHELKTPLSAIVGWAHVVLSGALDQYRSTVAIETIRKNAVRQERLINDLLDSSRLATGKVRLDVKDVDPNALVRDAVAALEPAADARKVRFSLDESNVGVLCADPDRLLQVLRNLLANAIKFSPCGGEVTVTVKRLADHVTIAVRDEGPGIPLEFLPHVFEKFAQAHPGRGLGLGLAISKELVEMHGGRITAKNVEGGGALLEIELPVSRSMQVAAVEKEPDFPGYEHARSMVLRGARILVVEDDAESREAIAQLIESFGGEVAAVDSAESALAAIRRRRPDVLLADVGLPGRDGWRLLRDVRALEPQVRHIPAAALTGRSSPADRRRSEAAGFTRHITKPAGVAEVIAVLTNLLVISRDAARRSETLTEEPVRR